MWSAIDIVVRQSMTFGISVALARLLTPSDFGAVALLAFFSGLSVVFVQSGLATALIQRQDIGFAEENAVFWANMAMAGTLAAIVVLSSPVIARFYGIPVLQPLLLVAAAQIVISALCSVHISLVNRDLRFDITTKVGLISSACSGLAALASALAGWGVWALALQILVAAAATTVAFWVISDWRPSWKIDLRPLGPLWRFGAYLSLSGVLEVIYAQGFALLVGKLHGIHELGLFNRASTTQALPGGILSAIIGRVALPLFSSRTGDAEALTKGLRISLRLALLGSVPLVVGLALTADLVMVCLFGVQWIKAAPILRILAFAGVFLPFHVLNLQMLLALGRSGEFLHLEIQKKVIGIAGAVIGSLFGIEGLAYALVFGSVASLVLNARPIGRLIGYPLGRQLLDVADIALATGLMSLCVLFASSRLRLDPWTTLITLVAAGGLVYVMCIVLLPTPSFREARQIARDMVSARLPRTRSGN